MPPMTEFVNRAECDLLPGCDCFILLDQKPTERGKPHGHNEPNQQHRPERQSAAVLGCGFQIVQLFKHNYPTLELCPATFLPQPSSISSSAFCACMRFSA